MTDFETRVATPSDINEHLYNLRDLAAECSHVTEMGVRACVSTWAFVEGLKESTLVCIDIKHPSEYGGDIEAVAKACAEKGVSFEFILGDTTKMEIVETDLLFIDTLHTYDQLVKELELHSDKARKYLAFHDTESCRDELWPAIGELMAKGTWKVKAHYPNNNGVTVLERNGKYKGETKIE